jgi:hypothetical protein
VSTPKLVLIIALALSTTLSSADPLSVHVLVALCDNEHQGIVPVPKKLGNGSDIAGNLY